MSNFNKNDGHEISISEFSMHDFRVLERYLKYDEWDTETAVLLLLGISPEPMRIEGSPSKTFTLLGGGMIGKESRDFYADKGEDILDLFKSNPKHQDNEPPGYWIKWAASKGIDIPWLDFAVARKLLPSLNVDADPNVDKSLNTTERNKLLKQIGALSLALAEQSRKYKRGENPNGSQIATVAGEIVDALPVANVAGVGASSIRESIRQGLELLTSIQQ
jgi:hypothetical protein